MPELGLKVEVFDPALPFDVHKANSPVLDTWHEHTLISKELRHKLEFVKDAGMENLNLSGGMMVRVPMVEIGIRVGTINIEKVNALVVEDGYHDLLLGSAIVKKAFSVGKHGEENISVRTSWKEDVTALAIALHPLSVPFDTRHLEQFFRQQRRLYNILLIAEHGLSFSSQDALEKAIDDDVGIPDNLVLQLSAVDSGSIWISLKSGAQSTLKRLAGLFEMSAGAKLAHQVAEAKKAEIEVGISAEVRDATASKLIAEADMVRAENIRKTHEIWRKETKARIAFTNDLLAQVEDVEARATLVRKRDSAIQELLEQQMLPMVKNLPRTYEPPSGVFLLPNDSR